jgi:nicotinamide-nucleotide amidase
MFANFVKRVGEVITPDSQSVKDSILIIQNHIENYVVQSGLKSLVIGISGGLDSAVTAAIVKPICRRHNIKLIGVSIPLSSSIAHIEQASWVGNTFCDAFMQMDEWESSGTHSMIDKTIDSLDQVASSAGFNPDHFNRDVAQGNIKARLRMISLYHVAGITGGAVLSTDNFSESWLGFWTLHGDIGDISPIQYIEKGWEEPEFASVLGIREDIISQKPSDGLSVTDEDSDEAQLGMSYKEVGAVMFGYEKMLPADLQAEFDEWVINEPRVKDIILRHQKTQFKRDGVYEVTRDMTGLPVSFKNV